MVFLGFSGVGSEGNKRLWVAEFFCGRCHFLGVVVVTVVVAEVS